RCVSDLYGADSALGSPVQHRYENVASPDTTSIVTSQVVTAGTPVVLIAYNANLPLAATVDGQPDVPRAVRVACPAFAGSRLVVKVGGTDYHGRVEGNVAYFQFSAVDATGQDGNRGYRSVTRVSMELLGEAGVDTATVTVGFSDWISTPAKYREHDGSEFLAVVNDGNGSSVLATCEYLPHPGNLIKLPLAAGPLWIDDFTIEMMSLHGDLAGAHRR
ncbi:MAG TPA: hypothetical protein VFH61_10720, partial [Thermoleophilia bacterium]|nr:hypothetical protein [Thermoleophilia bacterium]